MATSVKLDDAIMARIRRLATTRDRSSHWIMREAIKQYVDREEARESFRQEALDSMRSYQETGLHLTGAETAEWLARWGREDAAGPPDCHD